MIPSVVSKVFEQYQSSEDYRLDANAAPDLVDRSDVAPEQIVKLMVMGDTLGRTQVLFPANCMLDVDRLNTATGRSLAALPQTEMSSLATSHSLHTIPAIPDITGLPSIIDNRILGFDEVFVESGEHDKLIRLDKGFFTLTIRKAKEANFAVPLDEIPYNQSAPENDINDINQAIEKFTTLRIHKRLEDTLELPPLPQSAQDIIKLRSNPDASGDELANIVERDPSLSAQVVSWASSSFYHAPGKVRSVHDAIIRVLGFDMVMNLSMGLSLGRSLNLPSDQPEGYAPYWHQAMWTALGTTSLISKIDAAERPSFGLSYLSGLLHNFGYLVLAHIFPPHFSLICRYIEANPHIDSSVIEHYLLGITKEQIGSQLMSVWNMPEEVTAALRYQKNDEFSGEHSEFANLLCLTEQLLCKHGIIAGNQSTVSEHLLERFGLTMEQADEAISTLMDSSSEVEATASLMGR